MYRTAVYRVAANPVTASTFASSSVAAGNGCVSSLDTVGVPMLGATGVPGTVAVDVLLGALLSGPCTVSTT